MLTERIDISREASEVCTAGAGIEERGCVEPEREKDEGRDGGNTMG